MATRSEALVILTRQIVHHCPYKGQSVPLALCYIKAQDIEESDFCYGCDHVEKLKEKFGLRTFKRRIEVSPCKHCTDSASVHDSSGCTICKRCPGFEPEEDNAMVYVPTNTECTEWMLVNVATGERFPYVEHRATWDGELNARRFHLPLVGAPGTVPPDSRDDLRIEAAQNAEKRRNGYGSARQDNADGTTSPTKTNVKVRGGRRKKTP